MGVEMNKATVRRLLEDVWNQQNLDAASEVFAADLVYHQPCRDDITGHNGFREFGEAFLSEFPDVRFEAKTLLAEGDYVALHWKFYATHQGPLRLGGETVDATGKRLEMEGIDVYRMSEGQIAEIWTVRGDMA